MLSGITESIKKEKKLSSASAKTAFTALFENTASLEEIKNFLVELQNIPLSGEILSQAALIMKDHARTIPFSLPQELFDCCGTGGSGAQKTFNISTIVSFVLASSGVMTAKHGNRAASSKSGSADVLEALGVNISLDIEKLEEIMTKTNLGFLFAKELHPAMKHLMPIRKEIGTKTIFNILGPLTNPLSPSKQMIGVSNKNDIKPMIEALYHLGKTSALVVHSDNGLDELSIFHPAQIAYFENRGNRVFQTLSPLDLEINPTGNESGITGGLPEENAEIAKNIFDNTASNDQLMMICFNAGAALWISGKCASIKEGIEYAKEQIVSGKVKQCFEKYRKVSNTVINLIS